jgi:uncharacterized protein YgiM (DUF1202 family)
MTPIIRKPFILFIVLILFALLVACATPTVVAPEATAANTFVTADQSFSTPTIGSVTVLQFDGAKGVFLRSHPNLASALAGEVQPGDSGTVLGIDASGTWLLVDIKNQSGWAPIQLLDYTIAQ